jgi:hypothetical protein
MQALQVVVVEATGLTPEDKVIYMLLGGMIGFVFGYVVRALRAIEKKVDHVDEQVSDNGEKGAMPRWLTLRFIVLALVVGFTAWAAFQTSLINQKLTDTVVCLKTHNLRQAAALTARDNVVITGTRSEIDLWLKYEDLYKIAKKDPSKGPKLQEELNTQIVEHRKNLQGSIATRELLPYANPDFIIECEEDS